MATNFFGIDHLRHESNMESDWDSSSTASSDDEPPRPTYFFYDGCPLCLENVKAGWDDALTLPLDESTSSGQALGQAFGEYTKNGYTKRLVRIHKACSRFIAGMDARQLYILLDLVEPTFFFRYPDSSVDGAFNSAAQPERGFRAMQASEDSTKLGKLVSGLPEEIWHIIQNHGIGRLLFVMRVAAQLQYQENLNYRSPAVLDQRFTVDRLYLSGNTVRIHLVYLGGRCYIRRLSQPIGAIKAGEEEEVRDIVFGDSEYLAVKSDGIGVMDIAFEKDQKRQKWVFDNPTHPFAPEIARIKYPILHSLLVIYDSLKCRSIIPSNRLPGAEPYFHKAPYPPPSSDIRPSFFRRTPLTDQNDALEYYAHATYIPFATTREIEFHFNSIRQGVTAIHTGKDIGTPPLRPAITVCTVTLAPQGAGRKVRFGHLRPKAIRGSVMEEDYDGVDDQLVAQFLQIDIDGTWLPENPNRWRDRFTYEEVVEDVVGIWYAPILPDHPLHLGVVVGREEENEDTTAGGQGEGDGGDGGDGGGGESGLHSVYNVKWL
ncbi:hypothetical protein FQN50_005179 [Emmonsiellopsis sp. PD_5]|nr:hypothetical protein FQN50_005179 [Emmonsiellopsis sp. PD_5]